MGETKATNILLGDEYPCDDAAKNTLAVILLPTKINPLENSERCSNVHDYKLGKYTHREARVV